MLEEQHEEEGDDGAGHVHPGDPRVRDADNEGHDGPADDDDERRDERERLAREGRDRASDAVDPAVRAFPKTQNATRQVLAGLDT